MASKSRTISDTSSSLDDFKEGGFLDNLSADGDSGILTVDRDANDKQDLQDEHQILDIAPKSDLIDVVVTGSTIFVNGRSYKHGTTLALKPGSAKKLIRLGFVIALSTLKKQANERESRRAVSVTTQG